MLKHLREALRLAGLRRSEVTVVKARRHYKISVNGATTVASGTPRNSGTATWRIAADLRRMATTTTTSPKEF